MSCLSGLFRLAALADQVVLSAGIGSAPLALEEALVPKALPALLVGFHCRRRCDGRALAADLGSPLLDLGALGADRAGDLLAAAAVSLSILPRGRQCLEDQHDRPDHDEYDKTHDVVGVGEQGGEPKEQVEDDGGGWQQGERVVGRGGAGRAGVARRWGGGGPGGGLRCCDCPPDRRWRIACRCPPARSASCSSP